ncbi:hypothetical protein [Roseivirga sp.]|uniref:hypothetical protein n=1 Tax=Roseivirga sp. TaxID=1964215 RepID=UPI003B8BDBC8
MKPTHTLLLLVLFCSCGPLKLVPYDYDAKENNLEAYIDLDEATITLANLEIQNDHYVFGLGIQNNSSSPLLIDTEKILKYAHHESYQEGEMHKPLQEIVPAMLPKQTIELFESKERNSNNAGVLFFLLGAAITTVDAVLDAKDNSKRSWSREDQRRSSSRDLTAGISLLTTGVLSEVAYNKADKAAAEQVYLPEELFDKKIIAPGEKYYGKIFFQKVQAAHEFHRITLPVEGTNLIFDFRMANNSEKRAIKHSTN